MRSNDYRRAVERAEWGITAEELAAALIAAGPAAYRDLDPATAAERGRAITRSTRPWRTAALGYGVLVAERQGMARGIAGAVRGIIIDQVAAAWARSRGNHSVAYVAHAVAVEEWGGETPGPEKWVMLAVDGRHVATVPVAAGAESYRLLREENPHALVEVRPWVGMPWG